MIKYLETLHREEEFWTKKGALLEKWCYEKAIEYGFFDIEKFILINKEKNPTENYEDMRRQISSFPKEPLEIPVVFFNKEDMSYFHEIDFAIKIDNYLFPFECKGTMAPIGELPRYVTWMDKTEFDFERLQYKVDIINYNLKNTTINHPFLVDIKKVLSGQIKTEGILSIYGDFTPKNYENLLLQLRENLNNDSFDSFFNEITHR